MLWQADNTIFTQFICFVSFANGHGIDCFSRLKGNIWVCVIRRGYAHLLQRYFGLFLLFFALWIQYTLFLLCNMVQWKEKINVSWVLRICLRCSILLRYHNAFVKLKTDIPYCDNGKYSTVFIFRVYVEWFDFKEMHIFIETVRNLIFLKWYWLNEKTIGHGHQNSTGVKINMTFLVNEISIDTIVNVEWAISILSCLFLCSA